MNSEWRHREHNVMNLVLDVNDLSIRMGALRTEDAHLGGAEAGVSLLPRHL